MDAPGLHVGRTVLGTLARQGADVDLQDLLAACLASGVRSLRSSELDLTAVSPQGAHALR